MDRAIFELNASVEATSLYILICALMDQGQSPTLERALVQWHGNMETLLKAAEELVGRGVLEGSIPLGKEQPVRLNSSDQWR
jgi:hypothetical protein